jgi:hypothetical protein
MPRSAEYRQVGRLGRPDQVEDMAGMDCRCPSSSQIALRANKEVVMERFIHTQNLALFKKHLAEPCDDARRQLLLKLLAEEEAKYLLLSKGDDAAPVDPVQP